ncbi:unnamed protein product [Rhodiola kirilowii]
MYSVTANPTRVLNPTQSILLNSSFHGFFRHPRLRSKQVFSFSSLCCCKLKSPQEQGNSLSKKIVLFDKSPPLSEEEEKKKPPANAALVTLKRIPKRVLSVLSNLPLAIGEMFTIAALMALGKSLSASSCLRLGLFREGFGKFL